MCEKSKEKGASETITGVDDCIHLEACQRMRGMLEREQRLMTLQRCHENCSAYQSRKIRIGYVPIAAAVYFARGGVKDILAGFKSEDVYMERDLHDRRPTLGAILESYRDGRF